MLGLGGPATKGWRQTVRSIVTYLLLINRIGLKVYKVH